MATLFRSLAGICACFGAAGKWSVDWQKLLQLPNYSGWVLISSWLQLASKLATCACLLARATIAEPYKL